ncbi:MAG: TatD family deoxyribonuclease [Acidobacteria bacterium]|nr:TatD family deoxyribonuclease [Acidobacteriota bacterium]
MFVDSHCHLEFPDFDADREEVFARARAAGVEYIIAMGGANGPAHLRSGLTIAEGRENVWATTGIHPHDAKDARDEHFAEMSALAAHPRIVAIGEIGLDYFHDHSPRDIQYKVFIQQMELAAAARLPIVIHCRDAWSDCLMLMEQHWKRTGLGGILHCFSGTLADARRGMDMGFYISFAGNITFPKAANLREVAAQLPRNVLLTETDAPFLAPVPHRGKRNEPSFISLVAATLAAAQNVTPEEIGAATTANLLRFISKP